MIVFCFLRTPAQTNRNQHIFPQIKIPVNTTTDTIQPNIELRSTLIIITQTRINPHLFITPGQINRMRMRKSYPVKLSEPILIQRFQSCNLLLKLCIINLTEIIFFQHPFIPHKLMNLRRIIQIPFGNFSRNIYTLSGIHQIKIRITRTIHHTDRTAIIESQRTALPTFCGHDDNPVRRPGTINSRGRSIFQNINLGYILRI